VKHLDLKYLAGNSYLVLHDYLRNCSQRAIIRQLA
jgi:hypothetical protein